MDNNSSTNTTTSTTGSKAGGTFDSVLGKAGELWDETAAATGKATQTVTRKVNKTLGEGNLGEAVDDVANRFGETTSALGEKAGTFRTKLGGQGRYRGRTGRGIFQRKKDFSAAESSAPAPRKQVTDPAFPPKILPIVQTIQRR